MPSPPIPFRKSFVEKKQSGGKFLRAVSPAQMLEQNNARCYFRGLEKWRKMKIFNLDDLNIYDCAGLLGCQRPDDLTFEDLISSRFSFW